jgi:hypothetical protein
MMKEHGAYLYPHDQYVIALGLLREGQPELALDKLEEMLRLRLRVPGWVFDIFIFAFVQEGFIDEALRIINHRTLRDDDEVQLEIWHLLLSECSQRYHYEGVKFVWARVVKNELLTPSDNIFSNVLNTAARYHDSELASDVLLRMAQQGRKLDNRHFEAMIDSHANGQNIQNALEAVCVMAKAGVTPGRVATRSIFLAMKRSPALLDAAAAALLDLRRRYDVPIAAVNVVIEGLLAAGKTEAAVNIYQRVRQFCPDGPDGNTFEILLDKCKDKQTVCFLSLEMAAFSLKPRLDMYDVLIQAHLDAGTLDQAMRYVHNLVEMGSRRAKGKGLPWISKNTAVALVKRCLTEEDERVWEVAEVSRSRGVPVDDVIRKILLGNPELGKQEILRGAAMSA